MQPCACPYNDGMTTADLSLVDCPPTADFSDAVARLFDGEQVHRDAYTSATVYRLEQRRLLARSWIYLGHVSQTPSAGDFIAVTVAEVPLLMVRQADGGVVVLINRCAHKGAMMTCAASGQAGRALRCPYHAWAYRLDGSLLALPIREGYEGTGLARSQAARGLTVVASAVHRGFVFVRLSSTGASFEEQVPEGMRRCIDAMADRSPTGTLEVAGPALRSVIECNWKIYLENVNDTVHASVTHESSAESASRTWEALQRSGEAPARKPMAMEQLLPFSQGSDFMERMGGQVFSGGHSILGINASLHSDYSSIPGYEAAMVAAWGETKTADILRWSPQNAVIYPSIAFKSMPQTLRVIRPLGVNRTLVEVWAFRALGAPDALLERTLTYNRIVFSPMSLVAHDDVQVFESIQRALASPGNEWVNLQRGARGMDPAGDSIVGGTDERMIRNQYRAWAAALALPESVAEADAAPHGSVHEGLGEGLDR